MSKLYTYQSFLESVKPQIINKVEFPEIFNLDGFLSAIEDDGYKYTIKKKFKKDINYPFNNNLILDSIVGFTVNYEYYYATYIAINMTNVENDMKILEPLLENFKIDLEDDFNIQTFMGKSQYEILIQYKKPIPVLEWYRQFYDDILIELANNNLNSHNLEYGSSIGIKYTLSIGYPLKPIDYVIQQRYDLFVSSLKKKWDLTSEYNGRVNKGAEYNLILNIKANS